MIPLSDGIRAREFPFVNVAIIAANFLVWILYEVPHLGSAVYHSSFYPCTVSGACHGPLPWEVSWFTAMFMHGSEASHFSPTSEDSSSATSWLGSLRAQANARP